MSQTLKNFDRDRLLHVYGHACRKFGTQGCNGPCAESVREACKQIQAENDLTKWFPKAIKKPKKPKPEPKPKLKKEKTVDWHKPSKLKDGTVFIPLSRGIGTMEAVTVKLGRPHLKVVVEEQENDGMWMKEVMTTVAVVQDRKKLFVRGFHLASAYLPEWEAKQLKDLIKVLVKAKRIICYRFSMLDKFRTVEEFIAWIDENKYHFENADFMDERQGTTMFHGNLKEYSAGFSIRFFDKGCSDKIKRLVKNRDVKFKVPLCYEIPWEVCDKISCDQCVIPKVKLCRNCKLRKGGRAE